MDGRECPRHRRPLLLVRAARKLAYYACPEVGCKYWEQT